MIIAVKKDTTAEVFNENGEVSSIDAHDGMAHTSPIFSKLCNWTLQGNEVGTVKKTLLHDYNQETGTSTILKFAEDTITENRMLMSEGSVTKQYDMFKKMHHIRWHNPDGSWKFGPIDLVNGCAFKESTTEINFFTDICEGTSIYYQPTVFNGTILDEVSAVEI